MKDYMRERVLQTSMYVNATGATVREAAKKFGVSKSTVHKDLTERLADINDAEFQKTNTVLQKHKQERHLKGGKATKLKYAKLKKENRRV